MLFNNMVPESMSMIEQKNKNNIARERIFGLTNSCFFTSSQVSVEMFPQFHFKFSPSDDIAASVKKNSHSLLIYIHSMSLDIFLVEGESKCHFFM